VRFCKYCDSVVEDGELFCSQCGAKLESDISPQRREKGRHSGAPRGVGKGAMQHLSIGYGVAMEQPKVFLPSILSGVIGILVSYGLNSVGFSETLSTILGLSSSIISFILGFVSMDMSRDAYYKQTLDLTQSIEYVLGRIFIFFFAAIFGGLLSITVILIPIMIFMFTIMIIDETGIIDALQKAFNVIKDDVGDVLILLLMSIIASWVMSYIPFFSTLLNSMVNVIIGLAFIDVYVSFKNP
jgi:hypothetical protein